ncbi:AHH domain-containing protein [Streptomyces sp. NPDC058667]|uniref:AHH domain-containing protein n=1 Tax=Streptomyces sp. NPDC058667 TaxID=3346588 RepID=UPI0036651C09
MNAAAATAGTAEETAVRGVAYQQLHLPTSVLFTCAEGTERRPYEPMLEQLLLRAVAAALDTDGIRSRGVPRPGYAVSAEDPTAGSMGETTAREVSEARDGGPLAAPDTSVRSVLAFSMAAPEADAAELAAAGRKGQKEAPKERSGESPRKGSGEGPEEATGDRPTEATGERPKEAAEDGGEPKAHGESPDGAPRRHTGPSPGTATGGTPGGTSQQARKAVDPGQEHGEDEGEEAGEGQEEEAEAEAEAEEAGTTVVFEERTGPPSDTPAEQVVEGPSPLDGTAVLAYGANRLVYLGEATRYVRSPSLMHTVQIGDHLFSAGSFAVLDGPLGKQGRTFWGVATTPPVTEESGGKVVTTYMFQGEMLVSLSGIFVPRVVTTRSGERYGVEMVWTQKRRSIYPSAVEAANWVQVKQSGAHRLSDEELAAYVFHDLDRLVEDGLAGDGESLRKAAAQLGEMTAESFALVGEAARSKYVQVLVKAWTFEEQRHAILEIMRSLDSMIELQAVRDRLIQHGLYEQLFADLGSELWALLTDIGKRFGESQPLTMTEFLGLIAETFNLGTEQRDRSLTRTVEQEETAVSGLKLWINFEESARAVAGFVLATLDSFKMMLTEPEKIISGLYHLARFIYLGHIARKDVAARKELAEIRSRIGQAVVNGLRGAALLGVGPRVVTRIKWGVIIEALTWISEIKAVVGFLVKIEEVAAILRFLKLLRVSNGELYAARFTRLAAALHGGSTVLEGLKDEHEVAALLRRLPEEDGARLGAVLGEVEVREGSTLASLMEHPRLGPVIAEVQRRAELLHHFGGKSGGLTPELAAAFGRLAAADGFETAEMAKVIEALQDGEGTRFAKMLEQIGFNRIGAKAHVNAELLALLAADARRMEAVREYGIDLVRKLHDRSAGQAQVFDAMLARLRKIGNKQGGGNAVEFSEFVERLRQDNKGAWRKVDPPPRKPRAPKEEAAAFLERTNELRDRFPKEKLANPEAFEKELKKLEKLAETDPERAAEHLDNLEDLVRKESIKAAQIAAARAADEARAATRENKARYFEPGEAPPNELTVTTSLKRRLSILKEEASRALAAAMAAIGMPQPPGHDAHHIIAWSEPSAAVARDILEWAGINPRDHPLNGVYLPRNTLDPKIVPQAWTRHQTLHTNNYYKETTRRLIEAKRQGGKQGVIREMQEIKKDLINGWKDPGPLRGRKKQNVAQWLAENPELLYWMTDEERAAAIARTTRPPRKPRAPGKPKRQPKAPKKKVRKPNPLKRAADKKKARSSRKTSSPPAEESTASAPADAPETSPPLPPEQQLRVAPTSGDPDTRLRVAPQAAAKSHEAERVDEITDETETAPRRQLRMRRSPRKEVGENDHER